MFARLAGTVHRTEMNFTSGWTQLPGQRTWTNTNRSVEKGKKPTTPTRWTKVNTASKHSLPFNNHASMNSDAVNRRIDTCENTLERFESLRGAIALNGLELPELQLFVDAWLTTFDRGEKAQLLHGTMQNDMQVFGTGVCMLAAAALDKETMTKRFEQAIGTHYAKYIFVEKQFAAFEFEDIHALVCALQLHFEESFTRETHQFVCQFDMSGVCLLIMAQIGHWLSVKYRIPVNQNKDAQLPEPPEPPAELRMPDAVLKGFLDIDNRDYCSVRMDTLAFILDALHSIMSLHALLTRAECVEPPEEMVEITGHHKEASAETFFSLSMTSDCMPGSVVQYVHKFAYLFHSISQVVYYNFPTYNRQRQLPLADLQQTNVNAVNMLPLLTELRPDIPVFCEHTGAGCVDTHKKHKWSWVLWTHFVFLLDADMNVYAAKDLRSLLELPDK